MRRLLSFGQGLYYFTAGLWPLVHMRSFLAVTGPKTDLWLVRTVGGLVAVNGAAMMLAAKDREPAAAARFMSAASAAALAAVDFNYSIKGRISPVYAIDGIVESAIFTAWLFGGWDRRPSQLYGPAQDEGLLELGHS